jgi:hypothetical protein
MHGRLEAVAINRGEVSGGWEDADATDDPARFGERVKEAVTRTGYRGSTVNLLLAHPRLTHQLIETPPAKGAALRAVVQRQVERLKGFEGPPAWSYQPALPTKNSHGVLVHLFPRNLLELLVTSVQRAGLHLVSVTPCTAVLHAQIMRLPLRADEVALLVADTAGLTTMVVGRHDGQLLLARSLDATRKDGTGGLAIDLSRTLLFVSQQFGTSVGSVWLFGPGMPERVAELQAQLQVPVKLSAEAKTPHYWAEEAARLPLENTPNLVSTEQRKAPQRKVLLRMTVLIALFLVAAAVGTAVFCEVMVRSEQATIRELEQRMIGLRTQHEDLQRSHRQMQQRNQFAAEVLDARLAPVPFWFLGYLSEAVPPGLIVTNLVVQRGDAHWNLHLAGTRETGEPTATPDTSANPVEFLAERLRSGPFHVALGTGADSSASPPQPGTQSAVESIATWAARLSQAPAATPATPATDAFVLEGIMQ